MAMQRLNFPQFGFRLKNSENGPQIFDIVRRKFVVLQPEEWVRQHVVHFLTAQKKYPLSLVNVEKQLTVNNLKKRVDVIVFEPQGHIHLLVECKAFDVPITQGVFDQLARYNLKLNATYLMVTNGMEHYYCQMDFANEKYQFITEIPDFSR